MAKNKLAPTSGNVATARVGDSVIVTAHPEVGQLATVTSTEDGRRLYVTVLRNSNQIIVADNEWVWPN